MSKPIYRILIKPVLTEKTVRNAQFQRYTRTDALAKARLEAERHPGSKPVDVGALQQQTVRQYTFMVSLDANKQEIAHAVETLFAKDHVKVATVNTVHVRGKERRVSVKRGRRAVPGHTPTWKKAVVTLTADSPGIPLLEGA